MLAKGVKPERWHGTQRFVFHFFVIGCWKLQFFGFIALSARWWHLLHSWLSKIVDSPLFLYVLVVLKWLYNIFMQTCWNFLSYRNVLSGHDVGSRWRELCDLSVRHRNDHLSSFYDAHLLMAYLGANCSQHVDEFIQSLHQYIRHARLFAII